LFYKLRFPFAWEKKQNLCDVLPQAEKIEQNKIEDILFL
jgi:hypothetical protein